MKQLLTSSGVNNEAVEKALQELVDRPFWELNLAFILTAANFDNGDKHWLIRNLQECVDLGFKEIDIVDIAVLSRERWLTALKNADVIMVGGGGEGYLLTKMQGSGFTNEIEKLLEDRVYVGISAGAMATGVEINPLMSEELYKEPQISTEKIKGLGFNNFEILPHLNDDYFTNLAEESIKDILKKYNITRPIYALPDGTALQVVDDEIKIIGDGVVKF